MVDQNDELASAAVAWWQDKAAQFPSGKISRENAAKLSEEFSEFSGVSNTEAIRFANESGVLAEQPREPSASESHEGSTGESQGKMKEQRMEYMTTITDVVRANMDEMTNSQIESILTRKKISFGKNSVASIRAQQMKKRRAGEKVFENHRPRKRGRPPKAAKQVAVRMTQSAAPRRSEKQGHGTQLDRKIADLESQIETLTANLNALKKAKEILGE